MKKILLALGLLLCAEAISVMLPCDSQLFAVSGCCKRRDSYRARWYKTGTDFRACERSNRDVDQDNVFDESGLVWWDVACR